LTSPQRQRAEKMILTQAPKASNSFCQACEGWMLQSSRLEGSRSACAPLPARPAHVSDSVTINREIVPGICNSCSSALPISNLERISLSSHPSISATQKKVNRGSRVDGQGCVTVSKERYRNSDRRMLSRNSNYPIFSCHVRRYGPFWVKELTKTLPLPLTRNQSAA
jgi:hypothetical protein